MSAPCSRSARNGVRSARAGWQMAGRRFAKPPSAWRSASRPASGRSDGCRFSYRGWPTAPSRTASAARQASSVLAGSGCPVRSMASPPTGWVLSSNRVVVELRHAGQQAGGFGGHLGPDPVAGQQHDVQRHAAPCIRPGDGHARAAPTPARRRLFPDDAGQLLVADGLAAVGQRGDLPVDALELGLAQAMAQGPAAGVETAHARMLAEHELGAGGAHRFRPHDFVGERVLQHAVLMDAGLVSEGVCADDRLVGGHADADGGRQRLAGRHQPRRHDPRVEGQGLAPHVQRHHDFLERGVAGPLADAVDGAFHLAGAGFDRGEGVGHGQAQVVVAVRRQRDLVAHAGAHAVEHPGDVRRQGVAHRVREVHGRGPGLDRNLRHLTEEVQVAPGRVLGRELHVGRALRGRSRTASRVRARQVARSMRSLCSRCRSEVARNTWMRGLAAPLERLPGPVDVAGHRPRQPRHDRGPHRSRRRP